MDRIAVLLRDYMVMVLVVDTPFVALFLLSPAVRAELVDRLAVEVDDSRVVALRRGLDRRIRDRDHGVANREACPVEVDVAPTQPEDLAATHPRHCRET